MMVEVARVVVVTVVVFDWSVTSVVAVTLIVLELVFATRFVVVTSVVVGCVVWF